MIVRIFLSLVLMSMASIASAKGEVTSIDPKFSYILVEISSLDDAIFKGVKAPGSLTLARYDPVKQDVRGGELSRETALAAKQSPRIVLFDKPIAKSKAGRLYLVRLDPDVWVIEGASGTAFSLGSLSFAVNPGEIIDLGVVKPVVEWLDGEGPKGMMSGVLGAALFGSTKPKDIRPVRLDLRPRGAGDLALPAIVEGKTLAAPAFKSGATFGNYLGGLVNRIGGRAARQSSDAVALSASEPKPAN